MRYLNEVKEGEKVKEIYLCKKVSSAQTKAGQQERHAALCIVCFQFQEDILEGCITFDLFHGP